MKIQTKPLSVNRAWQGRRFKTPEYKTYEQAILWELKQYKDVRPTGKFGIVITWRSKNAGKTDIDNILKPFMDCLSKAGVIKDDRYCMELHIEKVKSDEDGLDFILYTLK